MEERRTFVEDVFAEALELPAEERSAFLLRACRGSAELRGLVESLLADYQNMGGFLDESPVARAAGSALAPGSKLGRYTIAEPLGAGGMGAVYRARDERLERDVAIKVLPEGVLNSDEARRRFRREALALAKLSHGHIASIFDVGEQDGVDYLVMECVPGETLGAKITTGPMSEREASMIALQIAQALDEAHEQRVVHRDLKPGNVMLTPKGQVKVLDFGIAKLLAPAETGGSGTGRTGTIAETGVMVGTPLYMSPEQAEGRTADGRTDLWSLGVVYFQMLTGRPPFEGDGALNVLYAILKNSPLSLGEIRPDVSAASKRIVSRALEKDRERRYLTAAEMVRDLSGVVESYSAMRLAVTKPATRWMRLGSVAALVAVLVAVGLSLALYHRAAKRRWALEEALPQATTLAGDNKPLAAYLLAKEANRYAPGTQVTRMLEDGVRTVSIASSPAGATVSIQDYLTPEGTWQTLGVTPLSGVLIPKGYFRWKVTKAGLGEMITAPQTDNQMMFALDQWAAAPAGMVYAPGGSWGDYIGFVGWVGPYSVPPYYIDRLEVTNREFQEFVDSGGYEKQGYWKELVGTGDLAPGWMEAMAKFRDVTGRPGPSTWSGGHYPEGKGELPVGGVSWYEAAAYAAYRGKQLPVLAQWVEAAPSDVASYAIAESNITHSGPLPAGPSRGLGPYGTADMVGNVREWVANPVDVDMRFLAGGSWISPTYIATIPEPASPFDRSETNGFRCVRTIEPLPKEANGTITRVTRDFAHYRPASDDVYRAYQVMYSYPEIPLGATEEGMVRETRDWREQKVSLNAGYRGERLPAYLFLPKNVQPPYQAVVFFPSARVLDLTDSHGGLGLGDMEFFDYVLQSGRAVIYPIYQGMYERQQKMHLPGASQDIQLTTDWAKDVARAVEYLQTRPDIEAKHLAYLGVSMGAADGLIASTVSQDKFETVVFLDGGFFLDAPQPGGDQADFAPRMKKPVLMVNGVNDYVFSVEKAQNPMFDALGTRPEDKKHVLLNTPHDVTEQRPILVRTVLEWLDRYMGPVRQ